VALVSEASIVSSLKALVGLQLSLMHHAGNMRGFHFGRIARSANGITGEFALHVQCPWRIESETAIVTGFHDWYVFAGGPEGISDDPDWEPETGGSLQELRLRALFDCPIDESRTLINRTSALWVTGVAADVYGGCHIGLDNGLCIAVFPCASNGEHWRLFRVDDETSHFVVGDQSLKEQTEA
jgi:hypothetical protein